MKNTNLIITAAALVSLLALLPACGCYKKKCHRKTEQVEVIENEDGTEEVITKSEKSVSKF